LRQERQLRNGHIGRGDRHNVDHVGKLDHTRDAGHSDDSSHNLKVDDEEINDQGSSEKGDLLSSRVRPAPSAVRDQLLAARLRSLAQVGFMRCGCGLASFLRPPGGYMRRTVRTIALGVVAAVAIGAVATSCGDDSTGPNNKIYIAANMNAANEAGNPPFTSQGTGTATFVDLGSEIDWTLDLTNMTGVTLSHIHLGDANATASGTGTGAVIFNLFIPNAATGTVNGVVGHGSITNANNANISLDSLRVLFNNGHAYVNVHTLAHGAGEIRAQVAPQ
jgi:hypothetical protein